MAAKECIAMLLAGGQGTRLGSLTREIAKPAVHFGGKYRIIDFSLSNCMNSGIDTVGVLTQYKPQSLNAYIGIGAAWDLDSASNGGVSILSPYVSERGGRWYKGTANALYENIGYMDSYQPEYVLVLSGDHIYKMDYDKMLRVHKDKGAAVTIAVMDVSMEEASRFGILTTDETGRIVKFTEKPAVPDSTLASMGIYIFNYPILRKALIEDESDSSSDHDFGKDILPRLLGLEEPMYTYSFEGYWRDVGTIESYYEANMELLGRSHPLNLFDSSQPIYSNSEILPPQTMGPGARVRSSIIGNGCCINGTVENSILHAGVQVGEGALVKDSILLPNVRVEAGATLSRAIVGTGVEISSEANIIIDDQGSGEERIKVIEGFRRHQEAAAPCGARE